MPHLKDIGSLTALLLASSQSQSETDMPPPATGGLVELPIPAPETEQPHALPWMTADTAVKQANGWPPPMSGLVKDVVIGAKNNDDLMTIAAFLVKETPHYLQVRFAEGHEVVWVEKKRVTVEKVPPGLGKTKVVEITAPVWRVLKWEWPIGL
jgi:hypothetical protein